MRIISKDKALQGVIVAKIRDEAESAPSGVHGKIVTVIGSTGGKGGGTYSVKDDEGKKWHGIRACDLVEVESLTKVFAEKPTNKDTLS